MKISPRIPSIDVQKSSEKEIQGQEKSTFTKSTTVASPVDKFEGPDSIQKPKIESAVNIYEGPKSLSPELKNESRLEQLIGYDKNSTQHPQSQQSLPGVLGGRGVGYTSSGSGLLGNAGAGVSGFSSNPQISRGSRVNKYEGPNSLPIPEIESKAQSYKGPDSIELPKRESPVSNYQGPDSITPPRTRPHVDLTIPGKNKRGYPQSSETSLPGVLGGGGGDGHTSSGNGLLGNVGAAGSGFSSDPVISLARTSADKYKGPDSLKRAEIESEVEKYKGPRSLFEEPDSSVKEYLRRDLSEQQTVNSNEESGRSKRPKGKSFSLPTIVDPYDKHRSVAESQKNSHESYTESKQEAKK